MPGIRELFSYKSERDSAVNLDKIGILLHDNFLQKIVYFNRFIQENVRAQKLSGNFQFHGTF
jgi:hypothetical protein